MPARALRPCAHVGCGRLVSGKYARCDAHQKLYQNAAAKNRDPDLHALYGAAWRKARAAFLRKHPLCVGPQCVLNGLVTPAVVVDHIKPHKGDKGLFWDRANWQPLCTACHNSKTAREDGGFGRNTAA